MTYLFVHILALFFVRFTILHVPYLIDNKLVCTQFIVFIIGTKGLLEGYSSARTSVPHVVFAIGGATAGVIRR